MKRLINPLLALLAFAVAAGAQQRGPSPAAQLVEMKKLDQMVGQWKGTGWIDTQAGRQTFQGTETVQKKLNGLALLVEGRFTNTSPGAKPDEVIHETLAVLSYDEGSKGYKFNTYLAGGMKGEHELKLIDGGWQWFIQFPGGQIRYTTKFDSGSWVEGGEMTRDGGATWRKFFEMTLKRVG